MLQSLGISLLTQCKPMAALHGPQKRKQGVGHRLYPRQRKTEKARTVFAQSCLVPIESILATIWDTFPEGSM